MQFQNWSSKILISPEGKHGFEFPKDFPFMVACYRFSFDFRLAQHHHDYFEVSYVFDGKGTFHVGSIDREVSKGDIIVVDDSETHTVWTNGREPVDIVSLWFMPEFVYRAGLSEELSFEYVKYFYRHGKNSLRYLPATELDQAVVRRLFEEMYQTQQDEGRHYKLKLRNRLFDVLLLLVPYFEKTPAVEAENYIRHHRDIQRLDPVFRHIERNYSDQVSLEEIAQLGHMSEAYFCRFFKKVTGVTLTQYIQRVRIDKAKQLLVTTDLSITEAAFEVGFGNLSYFYRVFRSLTHLSPSEYLERVTANSE